MHARFFKRNSPRIYNATRPQDSKERESLFLRNMTMKKRTILLAISLFMVILPFSASGAGATTGAFWCSFTVAHPDSVTSGNITIPGPFKVADIEIIEESTGQILGACDFGNGNTATTGLKDPGYQFWAERSQSGDVTTIEVSSMQANLPLIMIHLKTASNHPTNPNLSVLWDYYRADGNVLHGPGQNYADPYQKKEFEFAGYKRLTFTTTANKDYAWMRKHALEPLLKAGYTVYQRSFEATSPGFIVELDVNNTLDGRVLLEDNVIKKDVWKVKSGKPHTWGNKGTYEYAQKYKGTTKASLSWPSFPNFKVWEITAEVTFEKDPSQSTEDYDVYTTSEGSVTQKQYTGNPVCTGVPASVTGTYPIYPGDGYLSIKAGTDPIQYRAGASISYSTPLKVHSYELCCPGMPCESETLEKGEQEHQWLFTGDSDRPAQADGTLKGTYDAVSEITGLSAGFFEWNLKPVEDSQANLDGVRSLLLGE